MASRTLLLVVVVVLSSALQAQAQQPDLALMLDRTESARAVRDLQVLLAHHVAAGDWNSAVAQRSAPTCESDSAVNAPHCVRCWRWLPW
jgi:hypothetical protein